MIDINWQQILGGILIAGITWAASNFLSANKDLAILQQQMELLNQTLKEVRQDQREFQKAYVLRQEYDKLEGRVQKLEEKQK